MGMVINTRRFTSRPEMLKFLDANYHIHQFTVTYQEDAETDQRMTWFVSYPALENPSDQSTDPRIA